MHPNSYDSYNDIDQSNNSAVAIILEYMNHEDINDLLPSSRLQSDFARNYSEREAIDRGAASWDARYKGFID